MTLSELQYISIVFLNYFSMENVTWDEVIFLNLQNYFSMEKCDVACSLNFQDYF
jgi:hypothetical protein